MAATRITFDSPDLTQRIVEFLQGNVYQLSFHTEYWGIPTCNPTKENRCDEKRFGFRFAYSYIWMLIVMFSHFYVETYVRAGG